MRRANDHGGMMRRLQVLVDGTRVAALKPNEQSIVELDAGPHVVIAKMDWFSSKDLTVQVLTEGQLTVEVSLPFSSAAKLFSRTPGAIHTRLSIDAAQLASRGDRPGVSDNFVMAPGDNLAEVHTTAAVSPPID